MNQGNGWEILVHDRAKLTQSKRLDDVRSRDDTNHAGGGKTTDSNTTRSGVSILVEHQRIGLQVCIHNSRSDVVPVKVL